MTDFNTSVNDYIKDVSDLRRLDAEIEGIKGRNVNIVYRLVLISEKTLLALMEDGKRVTDLERGAPAMYAMMNGSAVFYPPPPDGFVPNLYVEWSKPTVPELPPPPETVYSPEEESAKRWKDESESLKFTPADKWPEPRVFGEDD
jgi:hypothetical protein